MRYLEISEAGQWVYSDTGEPAPADVAASLDEGAFAALLRERRERVLRSLTLKTVVPPHTASDF